MLGLGAQLLEHSHQGMGLSHTPKAYVSKRADVCTRAGRSYQTDVLNSHIFGQGLGHHVEHQELRFMWSAIICMPLLLLYYYYSESLYLDVQERLHGDVDDLRGHDARGAEVEIVAQHDQAQLEIGQVLAGQGITQLRVHAA